MPEYKLTYFNGRGRAELIRWIFAYGDLPYEDERIEKADWPEKKASIPGGKLPLLMVGDKPLPQSLAIARYVAKEAGLVPEDNLEAAYCDALSDTLYELMTEIYKTEFSSKTEEEKKTYYKEEVFPKFIEPILTRLQGRLSDREWFIGEKISWADLHIALLFGEMHKRKAEPFEAFPALMAHVQKVRALPNIKAWIDKAPETEF